MTARALALEACAGGDAATGARGMTAAAGEGSGPLPVVVMTTFFPNPRDPHRTPFMRHLLAALGELCDLRIVAPLPRRPPLGPWREREPVPAVEEHAGFALRHPRYLAVPGLHALSGLSYYLGVRETVRSLRRELGPFVLHAHCAYPDAVGAALAARAADVPLVVTVHGSDINISAARTLLRPQIRWALRQARRVVAVSRPLAERVAALAGLPASRVACIPCAGVDAAVFHPRPRGALRRALGVPEDGRLVVFVGHLVPVKGVDVLLRAWARCARPGRLVLLGEGSERPRLERLAADLGLSGQVAFLGPRPQAEVARWIGAADLLCLPSHAEGSPNVVVEALACGVPVVATRVGGVPDLVREPAGGLLAAPGDPQALAQALEAARGRTWDPGALAAGVAHLGWPALGARNRDLLAAVAAETFP